MEHGTSFLFTLPINASPEGDDMRPASRISNDEQFWSGLEQQARRRKNVLAMCDAPQGRRAIADSLRDCDVTWIAEDAGKPTLAAAIRDTHPSALLHVTGDCQQEAALHTLTQIMPGLPVISCTLPGLTHKPQNPHLFDYLVKPVSRRRLADACARIERSGVKIRSVVVVEDEAPMREYLVLALHTLLGGMATVHSAESAGRGLQLILDHSPDLVTLDLNLLDGDGLALAQQLHEQFEGRLKIIAITARDAGMEDCDEADDTLICTRATRFNQRELSAMLDAMLSHLTAPPAQP
jgi:CheY-like chemotaxis protein